MGAEMNALGRTSNCAVRKGPLFAPSSARTRQKYVRPISSRSIWTLVLPSPPGGTEPRPNTLDEKFVSLATSKVYASGRTPLVFEFSIISLIGCCASLSLAPIEGSIRPRRGDLDTGNGSRDRGAQRRFALLRLAADEGEQQAGGDGCRRRELRARHGATTRWLGRDSRGVVALAGEHASGEQPDADWISARKAKNCREGLLGSLSTMGRPASRQEALQPEGRLQAPPGAERRRSARTSISVVCENRIAARSRRMAAMSEYQRSAGDSQAERGPVWSVTGCRWRAT